MKVNSAPESQGDGQSDETGAFWACLLELVLLDSENIQTFGYLGIIVATASVSRLFFPTFRILKNLLS